MNKSKKQKVFNISLTFGVLSLLFACIFASFFVDTPNVLAYVEPNYDCTLISSDKHFNGSLFNSNMEYQISFDDSSTLVTFKYCYPINENVQFDTFLFSMTNYQGLFDYIVDAYNYQVRYYSLNLAFSSNYDEEWYLNYSTRSNMIQFIRPDEEYASFFNWFEEYNEGGIGTYLFNFNSTQELSSNSMIVMYVNFAFINISTQQWNTFKSTATYSLYHNSANLQLLNVGVIESEGSYNNGYLQGYEQGKSLSNQTQYDAGYTAGFNAGGNIGSWLAGIGEAPLTIIKSLFNIEIFGINLNTIVFSLLGALVVIKLIRLFI